MTRARDIANLVDANGDIVAGALDNVPAADVVNDTTPQLGGNLDTNGNNINFGDSSGSSDDRLTFGAGTDMQLYHDGSDSYVRDTGTGNLKLVTAGTAVRIATDGDENMGYFAKNGGAFLYYDNAQKLATTSSGIDVTGTLNASTDVQINGTSVATTGKSIAMAIVFGG